MPLFKRMCRTMRLCSCQSSIKTWKYQENQTVYFFSFPFSLTFCCSPYASVLWLTDLCVNARCLRVSSRHQWVRRLSVSGRAANDVQRSILLFYTYLLNSMNTFWIIHVSKNRRASVVGSSTSSSRSNQPTIWQDPWHRCVFGALFVLWACGTQMVLSLTYL